MTPTPETDSHIYKAGTLVPDRDVVFANFAQHLERERDALLTVVRWAYDNGHTPPNISRDAHKALAKF